MHNAKSIFWILVNSAIVVIIMFGLIGIGTMIRYSNAITPSRTITVTGEGETSIAPDLATLSFSVISQGESAEQIQKTNTEKINKALAFVKQQGINPADIKTTSYNLYPRYRYDKDTSESSISGYELSQTVTIKIRDLNKVSTIVGGLPANGINQISSLEYSIDNPEVQRARAREEAFANAREKAYEMALANGVRLARVVSFSESVAGGPMPPIYYAKEASMGMGGAMPDLQAGSEEVVINVSVTYEIR